MKIIRSVEMLQVPDGLIFNSSNYAELNGLTNVICYALVEDGGQIRASVLFQITEGEAISLPKAPYGGIEANGHVSMTELNGLVNYFVNDLASKSLKKVILKQQPELIPPIESTKAIADCLTNSGFMECPKEINHHYNLADPIIPRLHAMELRKIKKCQQSGFRFTQEQTNELTNCHKFIEMCRHQQGLEINIDLEVLKNAFLMFKDNYALFTIRDGQGELLACTITVRVNKQIVYNYLPAFDRAYKAFSPLTLLYTELCEHYADMGLTILDLGISSVQGVPQTGLIKFKERMGAVRTSRRSFVYKF